MHKILTFLISIVWIVNGLFCKLLNLVPRHQQIVARILGEEYAVTFTKLIGAAELLMTVWVLSSFKSRWCAIAQIVIVAVMNTIEFILAPDLLLFGHINALVALFFITVVFCNEFLLNKNVAQQS